ncbi:hypothetical protein SUGI_0655060 [Cryptomeria japonica]|uniref:uncharacterized GPI-anchored protein At4g28100 n=1 Tax=Cryptomeria japonica TaxID=3369 RepID=UPI0024146B17|nr:uncharacterized GPI-anchored protein At4g28100 [Cryptomeria japonica]GLJ32569.1 hypothetical protein SUGI_0655060 [Cryptomeria japonica]
MRSSGGAILWAICVAWMVVKTNGIARSEQPQQPLVAGDSSNTIPALPVVEQPHKKETCRLDLSEELFGGVKEACGEGKSLDRSRCCPVLAAWLYAAHARTALQPSAAPPLSSDSASAAQLPVLPDDSQACVNSLESSLSSRGIHIPRPNATCDAIMCFCGIRLHQLTSLTCPTALNFTAPLQHHNASAARPPSVLQALQSNCTDPSYEGCTRCLKTLDKLKGKPEKGGISERTNRMYTRDCELMGLTWLLAKNKTAYIPTVSAVLRAVMYSTHPPRQSHCSPDQENMPLALDSIQLYKSSAAPAPSALLTSLQKIITALCSVGMLWFIGF